MKRFMTFIILALLSLPSLVLAANPYLGQTEYMRVRNINGSTIFRGYAVEPDTTPVKIHIGHRMVIPDTFTTDSLTIDPGNLAPFQLSIFTLGTVSKDTVTIVGTRVAKKDLALGGGQATAYTQVCTLSNAEGDNYLNTIWHDITEIRCRTTGADSLQLKIKSLFGASLADAGDTKILGIVAQDSIQDDSLGTIAIKGPTMAVVDSSTAIMYENDFIKVANNGLIARWTAATTDTTGWGALTGYGISPGTIGKAIDSVGVDRDLIIGFSYQYSNTTEVAIAATANVLDTIVVYLNGYGNH